MKQMVTEGMPRGTQTPRGLTQREEEDELSGVGGGDRGICGGPEGESPCACKADVIRMLCTISRLVQPLPLTISLQEIVRGTHEGYRDAVALPLTPLLITKTAVSGAGD
ncbi:hypothetical protein E2C01_093974 [Portunus trituberculatus]|uniref:Uncharacterized protein n=1 Tax=Portunus trituberculatus TaxID=210409 RepID=A0A5B7JP72_PORTR|nr:hypothetical protein [Portunus trituberculatus]